MSFVTDKRFYIPEIESAGSGSGAPFQADADCRLPVTVIITTQEGTLAALQTARNLARNLQLQLAVISIRVVPYQFPLHAPPVSISFVRQRALTFITASGFEPGEASLQVYCCRDRNQCLERAVAPNSLVVIGGRKRWWAAKEQKLEKYLRSLGHRTIFVETESKSGSGAEFFLQSR